MAAASRTGLDATAENLSSAGFYVKRLFAKEYTLHHTRGSSSHLRYGPALRDIGPPASPASSCIKRT